MCGDRRRFSRDRRGSVAIEFAIIMPVFALMLLAGVQFGLAQNASGTLAYALEKAARSLVLDPTINESGVRTIVLSYLDPGTAAKVSVSLAISEGAGGGDIATVTGIYDSEIGLPTLAALPFRTTRVVVTPLREDS